MDPRRAYEVMPGVAGIAYRTLICALSGHEPHTGHAAVARPLHPPQSAMVWAHWTATGEPLYTGQKACPHTGADAERGACALFAGHPGLCTFCFSSVPSMDGTRAERIHSALAVLDGHALHEHGRVWRAGHDAALLAWDELRARRIWEHLQPWEQAAAYWAISQVSALDTGRSLAGAPERLARDITDLTMLWPPGGPPGLPGGAEAAELWELFARLPEEWQALVLGEQRATFSRRPVHLEYGIRNAAAQATAGHAPPEPGARDSTKWEDEDARARGAAEAPRLARLPYGWQVEGVRRAVLGRGDFSAGSASMAINTLRGYGIDLRVPASGDSMAGPGPAGV
jgi:hypothetical protein